MIGNRRHFDPPIGRELPIGRIDAQHQLRPPFRRGADLLRVQTVNRNPQPLVAQGRDRIADLSPRIARIAAQIDHIGPIRSQLSRPSRQISPLPTRTVVERGTDPAQRRHPAAAAAEHHPPAGARLVVHDPRLRIADRGALGQSELLEAIGNRSGGDEVGADTDGAALMQGMRDLIRGSLAGSLRLLTNEDRVAAALPVVCGSSLAAHCEVMRWDEHTGLYLAVDSPEWLQPLRSMREMLLCDLQRVAGVRIAEVHFVQANSTADAPLRSVSCKSR